MTIKLLSSSLDTEFSSSKFHLIEKFEDQQLNEASEVKITGNKKASIPVKHPANYKFCNY